MKKIENRKKIAVKGLMKPLLNRGLVVKPTILILMFFVNIIFYGCDECNTPDPEDNELQDICFSAVPVSDSIANIYGTNEDGDKFKELVSDGIIFSPVPLNKRLIFIRNNDEQVYYRDAQGNIGQISKDASTPGRKDMAIVSPDGLKIALSVGATLSWENLQSNTVLDITEKYYQNSRAVFSESGEYLAYCQNSDTEGNIEIYVAQIKGLINVYTYLQDNFALNEYDKKVILHLEWIGDEKIIYKKSVGEHDYIIIKDWQNGTSEEIEIEGLNVLSQSLSPDQKYIAISAGDGNIWIKEKDKSEGGYYKLTDNLESSYCLYPKWSPDSKKILYTRYYSEEWTEFKGIIEMLDVAENMNAPVGQKQYKIICNNALSGYWTKKNN